ncbi:MAG: class I SAM-dependent methyltransferase, partial [Chloroflexi bacterium]|nr:class I SAM-dependent methyltransferase [Chloroflexota bacterium]
MQRQTVTWEQMAAWWDQKQGEEGDLWHRTLINPTVLRVLGSVARQRVLDLACGNGALARQLARMGAQVTGVDASVPVIRLARQREEMAPLGITYHVAEATRLETLQTSPFDIVVCNMGLMDIADAEGAIREGARVLRPHGRFVASISHPCFDVGDASGWLVEKVSLKTTVYRKVSHYREVFQDWCYWRVKPDELWYTPIYHRPLSWYFRAFRSAGLAITA